GNQSNVGTGGVLCQGTHLDFINNIIWNNRSPNNSQIYGVTGGSSTVTYCNVKGGAPGVGNINVDPQFEDTINFYLGNASPCIDAGDSSVVFNDVEDPSQLGSALYPSMGGLRNDMGAYGGPGGFAVGRGTYTKIVEPGMDKITTLKIYPNPVKAFAHVLIDLRTARHVHATWYSFLGEKIYEIDFGSLAAGKQ